MTTHTKMVHFTVEGHGLFPFDMLRYDHAWPKAETDSGIIERTTRRGESNMHSVVELTALAHPTIARWESFGWKVRPDTIQDAYQEWRSRTR
jgi:hypothetical protein